MKLGRHARGTPSRETLLLVRDVVAVRTSGYRPGGLRLNFDRLDEDEQRRTAELVHEADKGTWSWGRLGDRKRKELEQLIERASDAPGIFERTRGLEEVAALASEAHVAAVRRPLSRREENGVFRQISHCVEHGWLGVGDMAVLVSFIVMFESGRAMGPRCRVERMGDETVLVVDDANWTPFSGSFDSEDQIGPRWKTNLGQLERNEWFDVSRNGREWTISRGRRLQAAMEGRAVEDVVAA